MILYIGNKLSKYGYSPSSVETLGGLLSVDFEIISISDKKGKINRLIHMVWSIFRLRNETDLILIDTYSTLNFYFAVICTYISRKFGIPYVPILRGGNLPYRLTNNPKFSNSIFKHSLINVAPSGYLEKAFELANYKVLLIPNNIEINKYPYKERKHIRPKILFVRAFSEIYNPQMALHVLKSVLKICPDAVLCMVGPDRDGMLKKVKTLCEQMGLQDRVTFTGKLAKEEWWELSKQYDIFINTTNFDNTPVSVIEAMALGLPVVSTNVGGIPYLVDKNIDGLLVEKNDAKAMSDMVIKLVKNPEFAQFIMQNARRKAESFDWRKLKDRWRRLIKGTI